MRASLAFAGVGDVAAVLARAVLVRAETWPEGRRPRQGREYNVSQCKWEVRITGALAQLGGSSVGPAEATLRSSERVRSGGTGERALTTQRLRTCTSTLEQDRRDASAFGTMGPAGLACLHAAAPPARADRVRPWLPHALKPWPHIHAVCTTAGATAAVGTF